MWPWILDSGLVLVLGKTSVATYNVCEWNDGTIDVEDYGVLTKTDVKNILVRHEKQRKLEELKCKIEQLEQEYLKLEICVMSLPKNILGYDQTTENNELIIGCQTITDSMIKKIKRHFKL